MKHEPAIRKHDDSAYGEDGYWYYFIPETNTVFKTDYPNMTFNPSMNTEELTYDEYIELSIKFNQNAADLLL